MCANTLGNKALSDSDSDSDTYIRIYIYVYIFKNFFLVFILFYFVMKYSIKVKSVILYQSHFKSMPISGIKVCVNNSVLGH